MRFLTAFIVSCLLVAAVSGQQQGNRPLPRGEVYQRGLVYVGTLLGLPRCRKVDRQPNRFAFEGG